MTAGGGDSSGEGDLWVHLATAPGTAGLAVVELYGPQAPQALAKTIHLPLSRLPPEGVLRLAVLRDSTGEPVDDVVVSRFDAESSWCGLAGWSVSCHGGVVVTSRVLEIFTELGGRRTGAADLLRLNSALDALQREAHGRMLEARTERAATYFLDIFGGALGSRLAELPRAFESGELSLEEVADRLIGMSGDGEAALRLARPLRLLIAGRPNVGKSTLFNALLGDERVVVSPVSGTTRDLIEETIEIEGYPVTLIDSAGLRSSPGTHPVEREGVRRALTVERDAVLFLREVPIGGAVEDGAERALLASIPQGATQMMMVWSKGDLVDAAPAPACRGDTSGGDVSRGRASAGGVPRDGLTISALSGAGLDDLREAIRARWLGPPESRALRAAPFTVERIEAFRELGARLRKLPSTDLDSLRRAFIECLGLSEDFAGGRPTASKEIDA